MACENENATATYGSLHDAFSAFKRADGAQTSAFGGGKALASAPAPATVHGSLSAAIAASGSLTSEPVAADGVQTAALAPAAGAAPVSAPGAAYGAQSSASAAADRAPASSLAAAFKALQRRNAGESDSRATVPVAERFVSINGEGACAGKLAAFVRFTGCNLRCGYCDTMWANAPGVAAQGETPQQLAAWVRQAGVECVTLTGGEPVLQPLLPQLVELLLGEPGPNERGLRVEIETNGAADLGELAALRARIGDAAARGACLHRRLEAAVKRYGAADVACKLPPARRARHGEVRVRAGRFAARFGSCPAARSAGARAGVPKPLLRGHRAGAHR